MWSPAEQQGSVSLMLLSSPPCPLSVSGETQHQQQQQQQENQERKACNNLMPQTIESKLYLYMSNQILFDDFMYIICVIISIVYKN